MMQSLVRRCRLCDARSSVHRNNVTVLRSGFGNCLVSCFVSRANHSAETVFGLCMGVQRMAVLDGCLTA
jgi:hypothetical protein